MSIEFHNRNGISGRIKVLAVFFSPFLFIGKKPFEDTDLPNVVFYSLRHSSTTYKLKLNKGDLKAIQGDIGHAQIDMITEIYAHILDEDRKINAQKFETAFYSNPDMRPVERSLQGAESGFVPNPERYDEIAGIFPADDGCFHSEIHRTVQRPVHDAACKKDARCMRRHRITWDATGVHNGTSY